MQEQGRGSDRKEVMNREMGSAKTFEIFRVETADNS